MPEPTWYFVGPDRTGFDCKICGAGFSFKSGICQPPDCPVAPSSFRNYLCPNTSYPTPHHIYKWNGDSSSGVSISVNSIVCPTTSTTCWSYTPTGNLNAAGRRGSSCSQSYVTSNYRCNGDTANCPPFSCDEGCFPMGAIVYPEFCWTTSSGCHCSSSSSYSDCYCLCPFDPCPFGEGEKVCIDENGESHYETWCYGDPEPCCPCYGDPPAGCGICGYECTCNGFYACVTPTCSPACSSGFSCSCGICVCNTASTCCVDYAAGWRYVSGRPPGEECEPCYSRYQKPCYAGPPEERGGVCYSVWKQKNCEENEWCCNDGRCYQSNTILCDFWPPPTSAPCY